MNRSKSSAQMDSPSGSLFPPLSASVEKDSSSTTSTGSATTGAASTVGSMKQMSIKQKPGSNANASGNGSGNGTSTTGKSGPLTIRKQNVACDACRRSKIRCVRTAGVDKCDMCMSKNVVCTAHYVTSLAAKERKKSSGQSAPKQRASTENLGQDLSVHQKQKKRKATEAVHSEGEDNEEDDGSSDSQTEHAFKNQSVLHSKSVPPQNPFPSESYASSSGVVHPPSVLYPSNRYPQPRPQPHSQPVFQPTAFTSSSSSSLPPTTATLEASNIPSLSANFDSSRHLSDNLQFIPTTTTSSFSSSKRTHSMHPPASGSSQLSHPNCAISVPPSPLSISTAATVSPITTMPASVRLPQSMVNLLLYMFSPTQVTDSELDYSDSMAASLSTKTAQLLKDKPTKAHLSLNDPALRIELAKDLVESYIMIVQIRVPLIDPEFIRSQLDPDESNKHSSNVLMAVVLAYGAKFSEHQIIIDDREETTLMNAQRDGRETGRMKSRLVSLLTARAQEVLETHRIYRVASLENVQAALLMEGLVNIKPVALNKENKAQTRLFWTSVAVQHLTKLRCNHKKTVVALQSEFMRGAVTIAWWSVCFGDAWHATYWRTKPYLQDLDYNNHPVSLSDTEPASTHPIEPHHHVLYHATHALSQICRQMYLDLFTPDKEQKGIPLDAIQKLISSLQNWRSSFLSKVGVPGGWPDSWDFVAAVLACFLDSSYHVLWIRLIRAVEDFGIREELHAKQIGVLSDPTIQVIRAMLSSETMHAANRISALSAVLSQNGYLRLDPNVLHHPIVEAGIYLAQHGYPSFQSCVTGLRQYGMSYDECYDEADMIVGMYERAIRQKPITDDDNSRKERAPEDLELLTDHVSSLKPRQDVVVDDSMLSDRTIQYFTGHSSLVRSDKFIETPDGSIEPEARQTRVYLNTDPKLYAQSYTQSQSQFQSSPIQELYNPVSQTRAQIQPRALSPSRSQTQTHSQPVSQQAPSLSSRSFQSSYPRPPSSLNGLY
ncbi:Zn(2)-C6 fungal-type DNA-binding domain [Phaffia rhodozyma]|uniref:Zn(2)-C6 fungal-type DNA-binding domain n=1 Tax=Phaffia rhodozyma TaxID=264483 RepID=A0A0F7SWJ7_PHARH|nr:Zn(2)-C6 fungal-type DNA-binding domain [Phaffia rhodozyma]